MVIGVHHIQFLHVHWTLGWVRLPDYLKDTGGFSSKIYQVWCKLPIYGVVDTWYSLVGLLRKIKDEAQPKLLLGDHSNTVQLDIVSKHPGRVRFWEEDAKSISQALPYLPVYEHRHIGCAF